MNFMYRVSESVGFCFLSQKKIIYRKIVSHILEVGDATLRAVCSFFLLEILRFWLAEVMFGKQSDLGAVTAIVLSYCVAADEI